MKQSHTVKLGLVLGGVILVAYLMSGYSSSKAMTGEGMEQVKGALGVQGPLADGGPFSTSGAKVGSNAQPVEGVQGRHPASQGTYTDTTLSAGELLPKGTLGASWAAVNPAGMGDLKGQNFIDAGYHTNTAVSGVSQSNRNPTWDIRTEPNNPQVKVAPWQQSTIEPSPFKRGIGEV